jgi:hypothetical protein
MRMITERIKKKRTLSMDSQLQIIIKGYVGRPTKSIKKDRRTGMPKGRPRSYNKSIAAYICNELIKGRSLTSICRESNMPSMPTVFSWLNSSKPYYIDDFFKSYSIAREIQAEILANQIIDIADDGSHDIYLIRDRNGKEVMKVNYDHIKRCELRIHARKWLASHLLPRKYGKKVRLTEAGNKPLKNASTTLIVNFIGNGTGAENKYANKISSS